MGFGTAPVKLFALSELAARTEAVLRRIHEGSGRRSEEAADFHCKLDTLKVPPTVHGASR
jgi:DNA-binding response OmpR family regulator